MAFDTPHTSDTADVYWDKAAWHVFFDERAGIREYDGGLPRAAAEAKALLDCKAHALEQINRHRHLIGWPTDPRLHLALLSGQVRRIDALMREMEIPGA